MYKHHYFADSGNEYTILYPMSATKCNPHQSSTVIHLNGDNTVSLLYRCKPLAGEWQKVSFTLNAEQLQDYIEELKKVKDQINK